MAITNPIRSNAVKGGAAGAAAALAVMALVQWEGLTTTAKHERIDPPNVVTVCYGMTNYDDPKLKAGQKFTPEQCKQHLLEAIPRYRAQMEKCIKVDMPPYRTAAMISFTYNVGQANVCRSSVARYMNQGRTREACDALLGWTKANGQFVQGLLNRRKFERAWCLRND